MQRAVLALAFAVLVSSATDAHALPEGTWEGPWIPQAHKTSGSYPATGCRVEVSDFESNEGGDSMIVDGVILRSQPGNTCDDMATFKSKATEQGQKFYGRAFLEGHSQQGSQQFKIHITMEEDCTAPNVYARDQWNGRQWIQISYCAPLRLSTAESALH